MKLLDEWSIKFGQKINEVVNDKQEKACAKCEENIAILKHELSESIGKSAKELNNLCSERLKISQKTILRETTAKIEDMQYQMSKIITKNAGEWSKRFEELKKTVLNTTDIATETTSKSKSVNILDDFIFDLTTDDDDKNDNSAPRQNATVVLNESQNTE